MDKAALTRLHWRKAFVQLGELTLVCLLLDYSTVFLCVLFSKHWNVIIDSLIWSYGIHLDHLCNHRFLEWRWCYQIVFVPLLHRAVSGTVGLLYTFTVCVCVCVHLTAPSLRFLSLFTLGSERVSKIRTGTCLFGSVFPQAFFRTGLTVLGSIRNGYLFFCLMKHFRSGGKATDPMRNFLDLWRPLPQTRYQCWGYESGVV